MPHREGPFAVAAQAMVAHYRDGVVTRVPSAQDINIVLHHFPGTVVRLEVGIGDRLSELPNQDAYRYKLATVYLGADDHVDLDRRYRHCLEILRFDIDETDETEVSH